MKKLEAYNYTGSEGERRSEGFLRQRLNHFGLTLIAMGVCFPLYYLGLFGTVDGPLNPARLGTSLADIGIAKIHILLLFISLLIIACTWNWIYNWVSLLRGSRLTCIKKLDDNGAVCGALVSRRKFVYKTTGRIVPQYVCVYGHKQPEAYFHSVRKGTVTYSLLALCLAFCVIILLS